MKPDWDVSSPQLRENLGHIFRQAAANAAAREPVSIELMRTWHAGMMAGLAMEDAGWAGCYRGRGAAKDVGVRIGGHFGVPPSQVGVELARFENRLIRAVAALDVAIGPSGIDAGDQLRAVVDLCAWAHGEWVRIHPFVNGSGRTARLWANCLAMRYGLPPFVRLRPRPDGDYAAAADASMMGDWKAMIPVFHDMLSGAL